MPTGWKGVLCGLAALGVMGVPAGCNIVGPAVVLAKGPPKEDALYKLPEGRPTIVFVDDRDNRLPRRNLRTVMGETVQQALMKEGVVAPENMIDCKAVQTIISRETASQPMDIVTIGRNAKAEVVVYILPIAFSLSADGQSYQPSAELFVKVLDVTKDEPRLWPDDPSGQRVTVSPQVRTADPPRTSAEVLQAEEVLARESGLDIAELFYKHLVGGGARESRERGY